MHPNILVIRLSSLGDIVLTGPVYKNLKAHWPGCRIAVLVKAQYASVLQGHPDVNEVLVYEGPRATVRRIRSGGFTHLLDLHANFRSLLLRRLSGVPNQLRYRKDALARRLLVALRLPSPALARHTIDRYLDCLAAWGVPAPRRALALGDIGAAPDGLPAPENVLLAQTAFLGDAALTLPLARQAKRALPKCRLTVLSREDTADIYRVEPCVDEVLVDDKRGEHAGPGGLWRLARTLQARRFDLALVPHRSLRSALAVRLARVPRRVGFSTSAGSFLFTRTIPFAWGMHDLERNLGLLLPLGPVPRAAAMESVYLRAPRDCGGAARRLSEAGVAEGARLIGVHPGSVWRTKRWPAERYAELVRRLTREADATAVLVGGPQDAALSASIADGTRKVLDWTGKTTLPELMELMTRLSLFITNDSGPMHVATASDVPTLAFFGPTTRELGFFPYGPGHRVLESDLACRPCGLHGGRACPEGHFLCMRLITVSQACAAALELLNSHSSP